MATQAVLAHSVHPQGSHRRPSRAGILLGRLPGVETPGFMPSPLRGSSAALYRLSDNGGGTAGRMQLDLLLDGTTLYPAEAQEEQHPTWPSDAMEFRKQSSTHKWTDLRRNQLIRLTSIEHLTNGVPAWAEAYLLCQRL